LDDEYISKTKQAIHDYLKNNLVETTAPHIRWEALKCYYSWVYNKFFRNEKKKLSLHQDTIEKFLKQEEQKLQLLQNTSDSSVIMNKISSYQNELDKMIDNQTKGAIIRSRTKGG